MTSEKLKAEIVYILTPGGAHATTATLRAMLAARDWGVAPSVRAALKVSRVQRLCEQLEEAGHIRRVGDGWAIR